MNEFIPVKHTARKHVKKLRIRTKEYCVLYLEQCIFYALAQDSGALRLSQTPSVTACAVSISEGRDSSSMVVPDNRVWTAQIHSVV